MEYEPQHPAAEICSNYPPENLHVNPSLPIDLPVVHLSNAGFRTRLAVRGPLSTIEVTSYNRTIMETKGNQTSSNNGALEGDKGKSDEQ
jgi:hypothetical protein